MQNMVVIWLASDQSDRLTGQLLFLCHHSDVVVSRVCARITKNNIMNPTGRLTAFDVSRKQQLQSRAPARRCYHLVSVSHVFVFVIR